MERRSQTSQRGTVAVCLRVADRVTGTIGLKQTQRPSVLVATNGLTKETPEA